MHSQAADHHLVLIPDTHNKRCRFATLAEVHIVLSGKEEQLKQRPLAVGLQHDNACEAVNNYVAASQPRPKGVVVMLIRLTLIVLFAFAPLAFAEDALDRVGEAKTVFEEIMMTSDKGIPRDLLEKAHCIVIVPSVKRGGFIVGAQYGV